MKRCWLHFDERRRWPLFLVNPLKEGKKKTELYPKAKIQMKRPHSLMLSRERCLSTSMITNRRLSFVFCFWSVWDGTICTNIDTSPIHGLTILASVTPKFRGRRPLHKEHNTCDGGWKFYRNGHTNEDPRRDRETDCSCRAPPVFKKKQ